MVSVWIAVGGWFIAWTILALLSMRLLSRVRPGERVPMQWRGGQPTWRAAPGLAAFLTPGLSVVAGGFTIAMAFLYGRGQAPAINVFLAIIFILAHGMHVAMAIRTLEAERGDR